VVSPIWISFIVCIIIFFVMIIAILIIEK
jgi:hypothetical protein